MLPSGGYVPGHQSHKDRWINTGGESEALPGVSVGCGRHLHITEGPYAGLKTECNQWEASGTLQTRLAIWEPTFMLKANAYCNQIGIGCRCSRGRHRLGHGMLPAGDSHERDTDGLKLNWGDADVSLELIRKICHREGFGDILAEGCARAADIIGRDSGYYALHIKGQDLYEPCRGADWLVLGTDHIHPGRNAYDRSACDVRPHPNLNVGEGKEGLWRRGIGQASGVRGKGEDGQPIWRPFPG